MKKLLLGLFLFMAASLFAANPPIYIAFHWHMHQPIYVPGETVIQTANSGALSYDLYEVFTSRTGPYTSWPANAVNKMITANLPNAGAQVSFSGSLIENLNLLEANNKGFNGWKQPWVDMISKKTSQGNQRLDMVAFGYHHPLMALTDTEDIRKQIQKHKTIFGQTFPGMPYSKGIFPPENAFESQMIPALVAEGLEWVMVDNLHFDRACQGHPWGNGSSIVETNKADQINPNPNDWKQVTNLWAPIPISAAWGHRPHWVKYVDPATGTEYKMIAVPTSAVFGNEDGRGGFGALNYDMCMSQLESFNTDPNHPMLIVLHHDGDNHGGGTDSYYGSNFQNFVNWLVANPSRFKCTTIQDYLDMFPPASDDVIHVEAGSWYGAGADPEFLKWNGDPGKYELNGVVKSDSYSPDRNSWGVMTATSNIVKTAEQINAGSADTKAAWDFLTVGQTSCYWYWDGTEDWDSHATRASNLAVAKAMNVVNSGTDRTSPSIYHPQREPYNPGATEWGVTQPSDFTVWSYVFDVSGVSSVKLKYRTDKDGFNPVNSNQNETYAGGNEVNAWQEIVMTKNTIPSLTTLQPQYKADEYSAKITGLNEVLVDYYVEAVDAKGNVARSMIQHVWVGANNGGGGGDTPPTNVGSYIVTPQNPTENDVITIELPNATEGAVLHWGVNAFDKPIEAYLPSGSVYHTDEKAARTPFVCSNGKCKAEIGPFNNPEQAVNYISFVVNYTGNNTWDNNGGSDYQIGIQNISTGDVDPVTDLEVNVYPNPVVDVVVIETSAQIKQVEVVNMFGSVMKQYENVSTFSVTDLPAGAYLLKITLADGASAVTKIIKK